MRRLVLPVLLLLTLPSAARPQAAPAAVEAKNGMVVCVSPPAADVGVAVLKKGGNAVDAAVAVGLAMAVTWPEAGNVGGGGFMMVYPGSGKEPTCVEYRETAPATAPKDLFADGRVTSLDHRAAGVPGTVRGFGLAHKRFGKLPWKDVVSPAVTLATDGFTVNAVLARGLNRVLADPLTTNAEFRRVYGKPGGGNWKAGDRMVLPDLGRTLAKIAESGPDAFYSGDLADLLEKEMLAGGGLIRKDDLKAYTANERKPVHGIYRGHDVYGPPPPSGGGTVLVETLNVLENFDLAKHDRYAPETIHLLAEAMKRAYCDRARFIGDPAFTTIPTHLTSKEYAKKLAAGIDPAKATPAASLAPEITLNADSPSTTHFSVVDANGMAVSNTYTLENSYGNRVVVRRAGYILNNEMTDFNLRPGFTGTDGRVGTPANVIAPGKRMLSSQTPTLVLKDGKLLLVTGSPGGRTITNTVLNVLVNVIDYNMPVQAAVDAPRMHHQWLPDAVRFEGAKRFPDVVKRLQAMGHEVIAAASQGDAHTIRIDPKTGVYQGAADRRIDGKAAGY